MAKVLAITKDGKLTYCTAPPDLRGKGRCNHVAHQEDGQTKEEFLFKTIKENELTGNTAGGRDLLSVQSNGMALDYVSAQTPEVCLAAVKNDGISLKFVETQTREICVAAVRQNGLALEHVKKQDKDICIDAVTNNRKAMRFVNEELKVYVSSFLG